MPDKLSLQGLLEVQKHFNLPSSALVEKDWHVVRALAAINSIDVRPFRLIFGGGTALSRAHRLTSRMSEDIDLKIVSDTLPSRPELRSLREAVTTALLDAGFQFDPNNPVHRRSGNESRYTIYRLPYEPLQPGEGALRPELKIETAMWALRRPPIECSVTSFWAEGFKDAPEVPTIACVALAETVAEKFVALTRRAGAELTIAGSQRDPTLVRHIYDIHVVLSHCDVAEVVALVKEIIPSDVEAYGHKFPAYRESPISETIRAVNGLAADAKFAGQYADFLRDMVYGDAPDFQNAHATLSALADRLQG